MRPHASSTDRIQPYAAGLPDGPRIVYLPVPGLVRNSLGFQAVRLGQLGPHRWRAHFVNPRTSRQEQPFTLDPQPSGTVTLSGGPAGPLPSKEDWILILTRD